MVGWAINCQIKSVYVCVNVYISGYKYLPGHPLGKRLTVYLMFVTVNGSWLNIEPGKVLWQYVLIFDYSSLPTLTYSSRTKYMFQSALSICGSVCMWVRREAAWIQRRNQKKDACFPPDRFEGVSCCHVCTTARSTKEETITSPMNPRILQQCQNLRKRHMLPAYLALCHHVQLTRMIW